MSARSRHHHDPRGRSEAPHGTPPHVRHGINDLARGQLLGSTCLAGALPYAGAVNTSAVPRQQTLEQLERVLSSSAFQAAARSRMLLQFLVEQVDRPERLKEYTIGVEALGKGEDFDPRLDPIVRAEASRLRGRLERYYASEGIDDPLVIVLRKGSYVLRIDARPPVAAGAEATPIARSTEPPRAMARGWMWLAAGVVVGGLAMAAWGARRPSAALASLPVMQFDTELRVQGTLGADLGTDVVISPDGNRLVFVVRGTDGVTRLATLRLDQGDVTELPDTTGARVPFFSPDGAWVGFWSAGSLKKIAVGGGSPLVLCAALDLAGASWGEDGTIVAALGFGTLSRVSSSGGSPAIVLDLRSEALDPRWPQVLPGGRHVLFTAVGPQGPNGASLVVMSLVDGTRTTIVHGGTFGRYVADRLLTYVNQGTLFAVRFDPANIAPVRATPMPMLEDIGYSSTFGYAQIDSSNTGTVVFRRRAAHGQLAPTWMDQAGRTRLVGMDPGAYAFPRLSADGRRLAFALTESGVTTIWVKNLDDGRSTRLDAGAAEFSPTWSPDGHVLVIGSRKGLLALDVTGGGEARPLTSSGAVQVPWSFSPDGGRLAFHELSPTTGFDLWTVAVTRTGRGLVAGQPTPFLRTPAYETYPAFSPDGRWIAYGSGAFGRWDVYVRPYPDDGRPEVRVSNAGGRIPFWLPNRRELLYRTDDQHLMVAAYSVRGGSFVAEPPRPWAGPPLGDTGVIANLDVSQADGHVLALLPDPGGPQPQSPNHVTVRVNAVDEIRRRLAGTSAPAR